MSADQPTDFSSDERPSFYSGFITLLLTESYFEGDMLDQVGDEGELADLVAYLAEENFFTPVRLIQEVDPYRILDLEEAAKDSPYPPLRSLNQYWVLDARDRQEELEEIAAMLPEKFPIVAYAYPEQAAYEPIGVSGEPDFLEQTYLQAAPAGIGASWVWDTWGLGEGINLVDLEQNWDLGHPEFAGKPQLAPHSLQNHAVPNALPHGTAVLGILCAGINGQGGVGIVPGLDSVWALSHYRKDTVTDERRNGQVAEAILSLRDLLDSNKILPGDVLLLEVERSDGRPTEVLLDNLDAIRLAVSWDLIVIEAAGNAGKDLATFPLGESGAIVVGASRPKGEPALHSRYPLSNYGERIDCFAQGDGVVTIGYDAVGGQRFKGTSAAAAIIAGAAALLQSAHRLAFGTPLTPDDMRAWLKDSQTGTRQDAANAATPIGVMPDLETIINMRLP